MDVFQFVSQTPHITDFRDFYSIGYLDPGSGYVFSSTFPAVIGLIIGFFSSLLLFLRHKIVPFVKKNPFFFSLFFCLCIALVILGIVYYKNYMRKSEHAKRVVILGIDGMESSVLENGWKKGLYPHLRSIRDTGSYSLLQTVMPPQSPIVWASFITGTLPSKHGIFDFIARDPSTYALDLTFSNPDKNLLRKPPFWSYLSQQNINTTVLFLPDTFPPLPVKGKILAGMGVPDITGTQGAFTLITTSSHFSLNPKWRGKLSVVSNNPEVTAFIEGPKYSQLNERKTSTVPIVIKKQNANKTVILTVAGKNISLTENEFSEWVYLNFKIDFFSSIKGMVRFYLKSISPELVLYATPINISPDKPVFSISYPKGYAADLGKKYGPFYTQGLPHDTWALEENIFDDDIFLKQADDIFAERKEILFGELAGHNSGLFIGYMGILDTIQHMYWRTQNDPDSRYQTVIETYYSKVDNFVGDVLKQLKKDDTLILLSDHGFASFDYEFNMNSWLRENGFLVLKDKGDIGKDYLENVDWIKTKAYAVGYNSVYINLQGREKFGSVSVDRKKEIEQELIDKLQRYVNPITNKKVVKHVYTRSELAVSEYEIQAPDLFVGYYKGIRSSWDTVVGAAPKEIVQKRDSKWSGDHLFDSTEIPGVLFLNRKITSTDPGIIDVAPTVLHRFDMQIPLPLDGKIL